MLVVDKSKKRAAKLEAKKLLADLRRAPAPSKVQYVYPLPQLPKLNFYEYLRQKKESRFLASLQTHLTLNNDFAFWKLYMQRETYERNFQYNLENGSHKRRGMIFDIKYHLTTPNGKQIDNEFAFFPLRPVHKQRHFIPKWKPYVPEYVTDGSEPIGYEPVDFEDRFILLPAREAEDYHDPTESRFILGPTRAFLTMRCTGADGVIEASDPPVPDKAVKGKARTARAQLKKRAKPAKPTKSNKKAVFAEYIDYDDPTIILDDNGQPLPTDVDGGNDSRSSAHSRKSSPGASPEKETWERRYITGDTLYWLPDTLTETLSKNLYFDSEYEIKDSARPSIDFDMVNLDPTQASSPFQHTPHIGIYFSEESLQGSSDAFSISASNDSIYFDNASIDSDNNNSLYFDVNNFSPPASNDIYFDCLQPQTCTETNQNYDLDVEIEELYEPQSPHQFFEDTSSQFIAPEPESTPYNQSCCTETQAIDISAYGSPSVGVYFVE